MAAAILDDLARRRGLALEADSAGLSPLAGEPAAETIRVLEEIGVRARARRPRGLDAGAIAAAGLILGMERRHVDRVLERFPEAAGKVRLLAEYAGDAGEVEDPYGGDLERYRAVRDRLRGLVERAAVVAAAPAAAGRAR
jgi:protein-tyrosine-phosphatase